MIEGGLGPFLSSMACAAVGASMSLVAIILEVAAGTRHIHDIVKRVFTMAIGAGQSRVFKLKREIRVAGVIETRVIPATRIVAVLALFPATPFV